MASQTNPFTELGRFFEHMQQSFEELAQNWDGEPFDVATTGLSSVRVDLRDEGGEFVLTAELPGFDRDDIDVRATGRTLRLEAEHDEASEAGDGEYVRRERRRASVARTVSLPEAVETDDISATYTNGVLTVRLPKSEPAVEGTKIEVE